MNTFNKHNGRVTLGDAGERIQGLPPAAFSLNFSDRIGYYLDEIPPMTVPPVVYGPVGERTRRILDTFLARQKNTGVMFRGLKGTGKTVQIKDVANTCATELGMPTITINADFRGVDFNRFIADLGQPCVFIFDEFEKVYDHDKKQNDLLTLLDGIYDSKSLFLFSINQNKVTDAMLARPGRILYSFSYGNLDAETVKDVFAKRVPAPMAAQYGDKIETLTNFTLSLPVISFDVVNTVVDEFLRYPQLEIKELVSVLNISDASASIALNDFEFADQTFVKKMATLGVDMTTFASHASTDLFTLSGELEVRISLDVSKWIKANLDVTKIAENLGSSKGQAFLSFLENRNDCVYVNRLSVDLDEGCQQETEHVSPVDMLKQTAQVSVHKDAFMGEVIRLVKNSGYLRALAPEIIDDFEAFVKAEFVELDEWVRVNIGRRQSYRSAY